MWTQWPGSSGASGPKERVTMVTMKRSLILPLAACCAVVLAMNARPALATGYYTTSVETDKVVYEVGEWATVTHTILNPSDEAVSLSFGWTPGYDIWAYDNPGDLSVGELYLTREPVRDINQGAYWASWTLDLSPGESYQTDYAWNLTDDDGDELVPGEYVIVESALFADTRITIVPEPGTLAGLLIGAGIACLKRGRRRSG